jgi:tetratricopeptide (TPR) repeat protein
VALLGTASVPLAYVVGRGYFNSVGTGMLAAASIAVSPLMVTHAHFLTQDVPLSFMVLWCLWACRLLLNRPGPLLCLLGGAILGLTITTRASGVLMLPVMVFALIWGMRNNRPGKAWVWYLWPLALLAGLFLGLVAGYPGFVINASQSEEFIFGTWSEGTVPLADWFDFFWFRIGELGYLFGQNLGLQFMLLWPLGVAGLWLKKSWERLPVLLVPVLFSLAGLLGVRGSMTGLAVIWLPAAAMLSVWPLVWLCRRLPAGIWPGLTAASLGVLLCIWPFWRSLGLAYIFWQQDTRASAQVWLKENLPPGAQVWRSRHRIAQVPLPPHASAQAELSNLPWGGYVMLPVNNQHPTRDEARTAAWQRLAVFDLKSGMPLLPLGGGREYPQGVSPSLELRTKMPWLHVKQPLALIKPPMAPKRLHGVIYGQESAYSQGQGYMHLLKGGQAERVLKLDQSPGQLGLKLSNLGQDLAEISLDQGIWPSGSLSLYPGQTRHLIMKAKQWPPMIEGTYPLGIKLKRGDDLLVHMDWNPLILGRRALESGDLEKAAEILQKAINQGDQGFDAYAMLAEAQTQLGLYKQARDTLNHLGLKYPSALENYRALALAPRIDQEWMSSFREFFGYHAGMLKRAATLHIPIIAPRWPQDSREEGEPARQVVTQYLSKDATRGSQLRIMPRMAIPPGDMEVRLSLGASYQPMGREDLLRVEVWSKNGSHQQLLNQRVVTSRDFGERMARISINMEVPEPGAYLELRLHFLSGLRIWVKGMEISSDLRGHLKNMLRWYYDAAGRLALKDGRFPDAVKAFEALLDLYPGFSPAYLPLTKSLMDSGKLDAAYGWAHQAERFFKFRPKELAQLREMYQQLQKKEDVARIDKMLGILRPSLKREAVFDGGLTLLGYDLPKAKLKPGDSLEVSYYWQCRFRPHLNYYIFVHLRGPKGVTYNYDHLLNHGTPRMTELEPGQVVREDFAHRLPAAMEKGRYQLVMGLWDPKFTGTALPIIGEQEKGRNEILLAEIEIQ